MAIVSDGTARTEAGMSTVERTLSEFERIDADELQGLVSRFRLTA